jgi:hypothetical protein
MVIFRFVQAAVSLAVVIPSLLELQAEYYGVEKGIPTLVMAAASFDNVLCISGFGVCLGLSFHSGKSITLEFPNCIHYICTLTPYTPKHCTCYYWGRACILLLLCHQIIKGWSGKTLNNPFIFARVAQIS